MTGWRILHFAAPKAQGAGFMHRLRAWGHLLSASAYGLIHAPASVAVAEKMEIMVKARRSYC